MSSVYEALATAAQAVPSRLKKRAALLEVTPLSASPTDGFMVDKHTVRVELATGAADAVRCSCLLSPRCAHVAAAADYLAHAGTGEPASSSIENAPAQPAPPSEKTHLTKEMLAAVAQAERALQSIAQRGISGLGPEGTSQLSAALRATRTAGLHRLERQLVALLGFRHALGSGTPLKTTAVGDSFAAALRTLILLRKDTVDKEVVGTARRSYQPLAPGKNDGIFVPLWAEPVLTDTGYAGIVVTLASPNGTLFTLGSTPPGGIDRVQEVWCGPAQLGDIHVPFETFTRHRVILSGGRSSADNRLGRGRGTRAALAAEVDLSLLRDVRSRSATQDWELHSGAVSAVDLTGLTVAGTTLRFGAAAQRCGVAALAAHLVPLINSDATVTVVARGDEALALWCADEVLYPGIHYPGNDLAALMTVAKSNAVNNQLGTPRRTPRSIIAGVNQRVAMRGTTRLSVSMLRRDHQALRDMAAPTGAHLIQNLCVQPGLSDVAALAFYLR